MCHINGKQNAAHLILQFKMLTFSYIVKKINFGKGYNGGHCHGSLMNNRKLTSYAANAAR